MKDRVREEAGLADLGAQNSNGADLRAESAQPIAHLDRDLRLIRRYAFVHSNMPFTVKVPLVGPAVVLLVRTARRFLRGVSAIALGPQNEFNAAVAEILFEFTRRASTSEPLTLSEATFDEAVQRLASAATSREQSEALQIVVREVQLLREQVRAAQLSASESERQVSELLRRVAALEKK